METKQVENQEITFWNDIISRGESSSAILMDGQYFVPANTKTILFPDDETQYFIHNTGDTLFSNNDENVFGDDEIIHLMNNSESGNLEDHNQIIYFANDHADSKLDMSNETDILHEVGLALMDGMEPSMKKIKVEGEFFDLDSLLDISNDNEIVQNNEMNGFQYVVQLQNFDSFQQIQDFEETSDHVYNTSIVEVESPKPIEISKITGKNLITGQIVTLDSYLEKVKKSSKKLMLQNTEMVSLNVGKKNEHTALGNLLNKKLTIGKTVNGQRLIGKVIHVGKKDEDDETSVINMNSEINLDESYNELTTSYHDAVEEHVPSSVIIENNQNDKNILTENINAMLIEDNAQQTVTLDDQIQLKDSKETDIDHNILDYVSRTMSNLMNMESVLKKLKRKNLLIKVVEKAVGEEQVKVNNFQIRGHLEMLGGWQKHEYEEKWIFKMDYEKGREDCGEWIELWSRKFPETMKLTITIVKVDGLIQSTKVSLNYNLEKCSICSKEFKSIYKLKTHMTVSHKVKHQYQCQICDKSLDNKDTFNQHRKYHVDRKELFSCDKCDKHFLSLQRFTKHMNNHSLDDLKLSCTVCDEVFDKISSWREHMLRHDGKSNKIFHNRARSNYMNADINCHSRDVKNCYVCKVCNRTFSRYSNLQRHSEIHGTKNSLPLYSCSMCGCTYNYISSLTRHIVQNHISTT
ncbi:zinc finger protein with KRAB and SCAN domains 8-like isoform X2 [Harmonia axyridis]|uniref:zinc finger protein with KRAB and SCAN domains 8-like isoform X2 n=1 Tax=Harmonia axyridis TaxID=115357 RepID=UPI001E2782E7|nr:zinc finger protein with KRAB and SCAN domains 8-like isoform X2 [Harmonia axyridis]